MFSSENGASDLVQNAIDKYEKHFDSEFPLYEHIHLTKNNNFDFSIEGAKRLDSFISGKIKENKLVEIPEGYYDRLY